MWIVDTGLLDYRWTKTSFGEAVALLLELYSTDINFRSEKQTLRSQNAMEVSMLSEAINYIIQIIKLIFQIPNWMKFGQSPMYSQKIQYFPLLPFDWTFVFASIISIDLLTTMCTVSGCHYCTNYYNVMRNFDWVSRDNRWLVQCNVTWLNRLLNIWTHFGGHQLDNRRKTSR